MINSLLPLEPMFALGDDAEVGLINKTILYDGSKFEGLKDKCYVAVKKFDNTEYETNNGIIGPSKISTFTKAEQDSDKTGCLFTTEQDLQHIIVFNSARLDSSHSGWYGSTVFFWNLTPVYITKEGSFSLLYKNNSSTYYSEIRLVSKEKIENNNQNNSDEELAKKIFEAVSKEDLPTEAMAIALDEENGKIVGSPIAKINTENIIEGTNFKEQPQPTELEKENIDEVLCLSHIYSEHYIYQAVPTSTIQTEGWYYPVLCKKVDWLEFKFHQFIYVK